MRKIGEVPNFWPAILFALVVAIPRLNPESNLFAGNANDDGNAPPGDTQGGYAPTLLTLLRSHAVTPEAATSSVCGSTHLPCSRIRSTRRSTASVSGMLNFTAFLPTYRLIFPGAPPT